MYLVDFFKKLTRKSNIPIVIYLVMNLILITFVVFVVFNLPDLRCLLLACLLYCISLAIALSPVGEWILRLQMGCKKIKRKDYLMIIEPLFKEVYEKAKKLDPTLPDDISIYMNSDTVPNAFATGRKTICVTEGLLHTSAEEIKAILGHEFGHLSHKDTDVILLVCVGNLIFNIIVLGIRLVLIAVNFILSFIAGIFKGFDFGVSSLMNNLYQLAITILVEGLIWIWTKIGLLLVMKSRRSLEYEADQFSFELGYGNELCAALDTDIEGKSSGLFANLVSTHPDSNDRIAKLQELGATYSFR